jgi:hypothetical protein
MFFNRSNVALLEVREVKSTAETNVGGSPVKSVRLVVRVKGALPPGPLQDKEQEVDVLHSLSERGRGGPVQDWFPAEKGKQVVVAFDGKVIPLGDDLVPLEAYGYSPQAVWEDCKAFYEAVSGAKADQAAALAKALRDRPQRLGPLFFHLIDAYDRRVVDDPAFCLAAADYLGNTAVPLPARAEVVRDLREAGKLRKDSKGGVAANQALASATIQLVREARKTHPGQVGHLLTLLSQLFVTDKPAEALPDVEPAVREELLTLARDKEVVPNQRYVVPLVRWLEGQAPGTIPPSPSPKKEVVKKEEPPRAKVAAKQEEPLPPEAPAEGPPPATSWRTTALIVGGGLGGLALLGLAIALLWKRGGPA